MRKPLAFVLTAALALCATLAQAQDTPLRIVVGCDAAAQGEYVVFLQVVAWRGPHETHRRRRVELGQFALGHALDVDSVSERNCQQHREADVVNRLADRARAVVQQLDRQVVVQVIDIERHAADAPALVGRQDVQAGNGFQLRPDQIQQLMLARQDLGNAHRRFQLNGERRTDRLQKPRRAAVLARFRMDMDDAEVDEVRPVLIRSKK